MYSEDRGCLTQFRMAQMFVKSKNQRDYRLAANWYLGSAKLGYYKAQRRLGTMYAMGYGVPKNYVKAYAWYTVSAAQGSSKALEYLMRIESCMTARQKFFARKLSRQYYQIFVVPFSS